jgi:hypothetical protein
MATIRHWTNTGLLGTLLSLAVLSGSPSIASAANFGDTNGHWAQQYIDALSNAGVIGGFPDGTFRPNQQVTRAQFAAIVNKALQLGGSSSTSPFWDVPNSHWAAGSVAAAANSGLVAGFPDGSFRPEQNVTRAQSLVVLVNGVQPPATNAANVPNILSRYRDSAAIPTWAAHHIARAAESNLVVNYPDPALLEPNRSATRAEVAAFTYQTLVRQGRLGPIANQPSNSPQFNVEISRGIAAGTRLPIANLSNDKLYVAPNETRAFSLAIFEGIRDDSGKILIPYGSRVDGRFEPAPGGTRFVAQSVIVGDRVYPLAAQTDILRDVKDPRQTETTQVVQDTAIGAAGAAIIAGVTGDRAIATEEVLAGGAAGAAIGNVTAPRVVVINPEQPLQLRLTQDFSTSQR